MESPSPEEQKLAGILINAATKPVPWADYRDDTAEQIKALVEAKLQGRTLTPPPSGGNPDPVSLGRAQAERGANAPVETATGPAGPGGCRYDRRLSGGTQEQEEVSPAVCLR